MSTFTRQSLPAMWNYRQTCIFYSHCVHPMSGRFILNFTVRQCSILDLKRVNEEKSPWVKLRKTGAKEGEQGQTPIVKRSWYNQADVVSKPSSSKDIGASRMKITALASKEFIDKLPDSVQHQRSSFRVRIRRCRRRSSHFRCC